MGRARIGAWLGGLKGNHDGNRIGGCLRRGGDWRRGPLPKDSIAARAMRGARSLRVNRPADAKNVDLVLAGGGVKGIGLVGAVAALIDDGYTIKRVSGTSAGAVLGSILAAASNRHQLTSAQVKHLALGCPTTGMLSIGQGSRNFR